MLQKLRKQQNTMSQEIRVDDAIEMDAKEFQTLPDERLVGSNEMISPQKQAFQTERLQNNTNT